MNLLVAAQSGWGKSFKAQHVIERNIPDYEHAIVLDFKDEYRGLVKSGFADWWIAGPREMRWSKGQWRQFIDENQKTVLARHNNLTASDWRDLSADVIAAARDVGEVVIAVDEAHFVAPQKSKVPEPVVGLATTGRGEGASSIWITQRLSKAEEDVISQCMARLLGGFESTADLGKVDGITEYPVDVHNPQVRDVAGLPDVLRPDDRDTPMSLQKHVEDGDTVGSEWIYSDNTGTRERRDTRGLDEEMTSTHYGAEGKQLEV